MSVKVLKRLPKNYVPGSPEEAERLMAKKPQKLSSYHKEPRWVARVTICTAISVEARQILEELCKSEGKSLSRLLNDLILTHGGVPKKPAAR